MNQTKPQRGFSLIELAIYAGIAIAVLGAIAGVIQVWHSYTDGLYTKGYNRGVQETTAAFVQRDNKALQDALAEVDRLQKEVAATEKRKADQLATKEAESAQKLAQKDADYDAFIADINAGRVVWRQPGQGAGGCAAQGDQGGAGQAAGDSGAGAGHLGGGAVPAQDSDAVFLVSEAKRADRIIEKLNLCRGTLAVERSPP